MSNAQHSADEDDDDDEREIYIYREYIPLKSEEVFIFLFYGIPQGVIQNSVYRYMHRL